MDISTDAILYCQSASERDKCLESSLSRHSKSGLSYRRKLVYEGLKSSHIIGVSDTHYAIDLHTLSVEGINGWYAVIDLICDSVSASPGRSRLVVAYGTELASTQIIKCIANSVGPQLSRDVHLYYWIVTTSLSCLPSSLVEACYIKRLGCQEDSITWRKMTANKCASGIMTEIKKGQNASISNLRSLLYESVMLTLTIHEIVWPLLTMMVKEREKSGRKFPLDSLQKLVVKLIGSCASYERGYRPIFHLERMAVDLTLAYDE